MWAARDCPTDKQKIRNCVKKEFSPYITQRDPVKLAEVTAKADFITKELEALAMLHKYRTIKRNYDPSFLESVISKE